MAKRKSNNKNSGGCFTFILGLCIIVSLFSVSPKLFLVLAEIWFLTSILDPKKRDIDLDNINVDSLSGEEFERYCVEIIKNSPNYAGYNIYTTKTTGDFGADIIVSNNVDKICIQCKRYHGIVGVKAVQEVISSKAIYDANKACVMTNSSFSKSAKELADAAGVELIDRAALCTMIYDKSKYTDTTSRKNIVILIVFIILIILTIIFIP